MCAAQNGSVEKECTGPGACSLEHCSVCVFSAADSDVLSSRIWPLLSLSRHSRHPLEKSPHLVQFPLWRPLLPWGLRPSHLPGRVAAQSQTVARV